MIEKSRAFLTGSKSKLARAFEIMITRQWDIEIGMMDGRVINGKVTCFEMTPSYFALGVTNSGGFHLINFAHTSSMRMPSKLAKELSRAKRKDPDRRRM